MCLQTRPSFPRMICVCISRGKCRSKRGEAAKRLRERGVAFLYAEEDEKTEKDKAAFSFLPAVTL